MNHDQLRRASQAVLPFAVPAMPMRPDNQTFQAATRQAAAPVLPLVRGAGP